MTDKQKFNVEEETLKQRDRYSFNFVQGLELAYSSAKVKTIHIAVNPDAQTFIPVCIGIDPGANFGITLLRENDMTIYYGKLVQPYTESSYDLFRSLFSTTVAIPVYMEGPAYGMTYWQSGLAEIRAGFRLACAHWGFPCKYVSPHSARKEVFGTAKVSGKKVWDMIDNNAADSLALALYGRETYGKED